MKNVVLLMLTTGLLGCATYTPYQGKTIVEEVVKTDKKKNRAFDDSLSFFAKYMNDSNSAVKMKEREGGHLVVKITYPCSIENAFGQMVDSNLDYVVDIQFKDKKAKLKLELNKGYRSPTGTTVVLPDNIRPAIEGCVDKLFSSLKLELSKAPPSDW